MRGVLLPVTHEVHNEFASNFVTGRLRPEWNQADPLFDLEDIMSDYEFHHRNKFPQLQNTINLHTKTSQRNLSLLSAKMSIANTSSLQLKAGKGLANVSIFRRDGWPSLAEWGLSVYPNWDAGCHGDTDEMLRRQPPAYSVQTSCTDILLPHSPPYVMTVSSHPT